jgi:hypothetical protein
MITIEQIKVDNQGIFVNDEQVCRFSHDGRFFTAAQAFRHKGWYITSFGRGSLDLYFIEERIDVILEIVCGEIEVRIY